MSETKRFKADSSADQSQEMVVASDLPRPTVIVPEEKPDFIWDALWECTSICPDAIGVVMEYVRMAVHDFCLTVSGMDPLRMPTCYAFVDRFLNDTMTVAFYTASVECSISHLLACGRFGRCDALFGKPPLSSLAEEDESKPHVTEISPNIKIQVGDTSLDFYEGVACDHQYRLVLTHWSLPGLAFVHPRIPIAPEFFLPQPSFEGILYNRRRNGSPQFVGLFGPSGYSRGEFFMGQIPVHFCGEYQPTEKKSFPKLVRGYVTDHSSYRVDVDSVSKFSSTFPIDTFQGRIIEKVKFGRNLATVTTGTFATTCGIDLWEYMPRCLKQSECDTVVKFETWKPMRPYIEPPGPSVRNCIFLDRRFL